MADAPDFVLLIQIAITLDQEAVPPSAVTRKAILRLDRFDDNSAAYTTVVSYTVPAGKTFELEAVEIASDDYYTPEFRVVIGDVEQFADKKLQTALNASFSGAQVAAGKSITVQVRSDGVTNVIVDAAIEGQEIG